MNEKVFWQIIEDAGKNVVVNPVASSRKRENFDSERCYLLSVIYERVEAGEELESKRIAAINAELDKLSVSELEEFQKIFLSKLASCFTGYLVEVADVLLGFFVGIHIDDYMGTGLDVFAWLIFQGKSVYDSVLENPDNIAPLLSQDSDYTSAWDTEYVSLASSLYRKKSGKAYPVNLVAYIVENCPEETPENKWNFQNPNEFKERCPRLYKRLSSELIQMSNHDMSRWCL